MDKKYPMTYEEFEKRVCELFLNQAKSPSEVEDRKQFLENEKKMGTIEGEYSHACRYYDDPKSPSDEFTDEGLLLQPVRILDMLY